MTGYPTIELYIDGRWKQADGQPVLNPADETVLGSVPTATIGDLDDAIAASVRGFAIWRKTAPAKRTQIILKAVSLMRERVNDMAMAMTLEQGKPLDQARLEILRGCEIIEWDATDFQLPITFSIRADPLIGEILNRRNHL
jgi:succinate-semialdehyde dehydrogenase/glutarate-semialdehyde dehydrogenase